MASAKHSAVKQMSQQCFQVVKTIGALATDRKAITIIDTTAVTTVVVRTLMMDWFSQPVYDCVAVTIKFVDRVFTGQHQAIVANIAFAAVPDSQGEASLIDLNFKCQLVN